MSANKELLKAIHENASIGKDTLSRLIKRSRDANMRNAMAEQFATYHEVVVEAEKLMSGNGEFYGRRIPRAPIFASMFANLSIDSTSTHMAEMLLRGSIMGLIDIKRQLREHEGADQNIRELGEKLLMGEANNIRQMYDDL